MKTKILIFISFFLFTFTASADFGLGFGAGYDFSTKPNSFTSASFRADTNPWCFSLNAHFSDDLSFFENAFSFSADNWFVNKSLSKYVDYYFLWGVSAAFQRDFSSDESDFILGFGSRVGAGLDFFFLQRKLEVFSQVVWDMYFGLERENEENSFLFRPVNFPCSIGIRIWHKS